jgi:hypothetical protein
LSFSLTSLARQVLPSLIRLTIREIKPNNQTRQIHNYANSFSRSLKSMTMREADAWKECISSYDMTLLAASPAETK